MPVSCPRVGCPVAAGAATSGRALRRPSHSRRRCRASCPRVPPSQQTHTHNTQALADWPDCFQLHTTDINPHRLTTTVMKYRHRLTDSDQSLHNVYWVTDSLRISERKYWWSAETYVYADATQMLPQVGNASCLLRSHCADWASLQLLNV